MELKLPKVKKQLHKPACMVKKWGGATHTLENLAPCSSLIACDSGLRVHAL